MASERSNEHAGILFDLNMKGHRPSYFDVFKKELSFAVLIGSPFQHFSELLKAPRLFCLTVDDYLIHFTLIALIRSLLGRPTLGLSLRIENIFQRMTLKRAIKKVLFQMILKSKHAHVCSLKPFSLEPQLDDIARTWIFDPQWWDLSVLPVQALKIKEDVLQFWKQAKSENKPIIVLPGHQTLIKGIEIFSDFARKHPDILCVCIGPKGDVSEDVWNEFQSAGGQKLLTSLSDEDLSWIYANTDAIWACYRSDYDQSSGIFGRSIQRYKKVAVRENSFLHLYAVAAKVPNVIVVNEIGEIQDKPDVQVSFSEISPYSAKSASAYSLSEIRSLLEIS